MSTDCGIVSQLQLFTAQLDSTPRQPRDVPTRARETSDEPSPNGIGDVQHDDGCTRGGILSSQGRCCTGRDNDINLEPHQLGYKIRKPLQLPLRPSEFNGDVLPLHPAAFAESLREGLERRV